jgi:hypothetical protein
MKKFIKYWFLDLEEDEPINWLQLFYIFLFVLVGSIEDIIL